jgi:OmpA-OmpF porin, OOP family
MKKYLTFISLAFLIGCSGTELEGRANVVKKLIVTATNNGAYKCAPKQLAQAKAYYVFSQDEMSQGKYFEAKKLIKTAERAARSAIRKSPPEKCAKKIVIAPEVKDIPVKIIVKKLDTDGDGILDIDDKCPKIPEDKDGFEDEDGCPELDNDKDGIPDKTDKCPGTEKDKKNNFISTKEDKDGFEDEDGCPDVDNDKDGIYDKVDKCPAKDKDKADKFKMTKEDMDGFEDDDGCPDFDNDKDGLVDKIDKCPNKPETKNNYKDDDGCPDQLKLIKVTLKKIELKKKIFFAYNRSKIKRKSYALLNEIAKVMLSRSKMTVRIEGHTDNKGGRRYNRRLSRRRARSVRKYLIKKGVDPSRMVSKGYGLKKPIASNKNKKGRAKNRRVEFIITNQ